MLGPSWFLQPGATFGVPGPASHALALDVRSDDLTVTPAAASGARPTPARSSEGVESGAATDPILLDRTAPAGMTRITRGEVRPVPFPVMIADIGGTNVRLALLLEAHSPLREFATVQTSDFATFAEAATAVVLDTTAVMPRSLLVALAGPATGPSLRLTNADWVIEPEALRTALNLDTVITFNDFEALALSLPGLRGEQIMAVGGGEPVSRAPRVVLGPATGLGVAALVYGDQCYTPIAGEGGHVSLGPETARDFAIWPRLDRFHGRISAEALLTGDGLARIYRALAAEAGQDGAWCRYGADVTSRADDPLADEAIDLFLTYLGRVAGDLALIFFARGGVYIAGGIVPRLAHRVAQSGFREAFEAKAPHRAITEAIPTYLVIEPKPAVAGMASYATLPERFAIDLTGRRFGA